MEAVTGQVSVAVQFVNKKAGGKMMTAGQLRDQGDIEKLIQQHNSHQILQQLRCSPPPIGNQPKWI
jgi:hypothetical protein